jgi:hypothetical protein
VLVSIRVNRLSENDELFEDNGRRSRWERGGLRHVNSLEMVSRLSASTKTLFLNQQKAVLDFFRRARGIVLSE